MRLDKYLSQAGLGSRKDVKKLIKKGVVFVGGNCVKDAGFHIELSDKVVCEGNLIEYMQFVYIMLNKPAGYVSATYDGEHQTVIDLIDGYENYDLFPVGRLDKDTEGLLILTNDGKLSHRLLSPKNHVNKRYFVRFEGDLSDEDILKFESGVELEDGYICKSARIIESELDDEQNIECISAQLHQAQIIITEGKYHQVKRMFQAVGKHVVYLKRIAMGALELDENLRLGDYRELTEAEIDLLQQNLP